MRSIGAHTPSSQDLVVFDEKMKKTDSEYQQILRMLPAIPACAWARKAVLLELADRMGRADDMHEGRRKMQVYFTAWLDKLLEAGVDVAAVDADGRDCMELLGRGVRKPPNMAKLMAKRLIDEGFDFVGRESVLKIANSKILSATLEYQAMRARRGVVGCDASGNTVLHSAARHRVDLLCWYHAQTSMGRVKRAMFDAGQNSANQDGCTPLHVLWDTLEKKHFDGLDHTDFPKAWRATATLVDLLGGSLQARDARGRSVLDVISARMDAGLDTTPPNGLDPVSDEIHARVMQAIMQDGVRFSSGPSKPSPRL